MTIAGVIKKAVDGGYCDLERVESLCQMPAFAQCQIWMDPKFWQSLGRGDGWPEYKITTTQHGMKVRHQRIWLNRWHRFIDHLAEGKSIESFFADIVD